MKKKKINVHIALKKIFLIVQYNAVERQRVICDTYVITAINSLPSVLLPPPPLMFRQKMQLMFLRNRSAPIVKTLPWWETYLCKPTPEFPSSLNVK